jgi:hypothetical protein
MAISFGVRVRMGSAAAVALAVIAIVGAHQPSPDVIPPASHAQVSPTKTVAVQWPKTASRCTASVESDRTDMSSPLYPHALAVSQALAKVGNQKAALAALPIVHSSRLPLGTVIQYIPPSSWKPASATNAELAYYSIPVRPAGGTALQAWKSEWIDHFSKVLAVSFCTPSPAATTVTYGTTV